MKQEIHTDRLVLDALTLNDVKFIFDLVNSPGWIKFIGDRNIKTIGDAEKYVRKIIENPTVDYWVARLKHSLIPIGIVTMIKRDYLNFRDIGFALLPNYSKAGYAFEASRAVLDDLVADPLNEKILATTLKENVNSIQLLEKLGLRFHEEIVVDEEQLLVFALDIPIS